MGNQLFEGQTISNAPRIIFENTKGLGATNGNDGPAGQIRISNRQIVDYELGQRTFVHELGNYLASKIVVTDFLMLDPAKAAKGMDPATNLNYFGDPNGIIGEAGTGPDYDTGANLERCVFGNVVP